MKRRAHLFYLPLFRSPILPHFDKYYLETKCNLKMTVIYNVAPCSLLEIDLRSGVLIASIIRAIAERKNYKMKDTERNKE
jgi:hypothetical protein